MHGTTLLASQCLVLVTLGPRGICLIYIPEPEGHEPHIYQADPCNIYIYNNFGTKNITKYNRIEFARLN